MRPRANRCLFARVGVAFDLACQRLGHPPRDRVLMVGDNWSADIEGAARYGMDTCWFNPGHQTRPTATPITLEVASLGELASWMTREGTEPEA